MSQNARLTLVGVVLFVLVASLPVAVGLRQVTAATPNNFPGYQPIREDRILNYDYKLEDGEIKEYDWPVNLFFTNGASVPIVNSVFSPFFPHHISQTNDEPIPDFIWKQSRSPMTGCASDSTHGFCDTDKGMKDYGCSAKDDLHIGTGPNKGTHHIRIYAPREPLDYRGARADSMYSPQWTYYVFATSHEDHNECQWTVAGHTFHYNHGFQWFGNSERVENWVVAKARQLSSGVRAVYSDKVWMANREVGDGFPVEGTGLTGRTDGNHIWLSDGRASRIVLNAAASASTVPPGEPFNPYPSAALTRYYNYHEGGGSGDHWVTTGKADSTYDVVEGTLGFLETSLVPGTAPLYECEENATEHFLSRDVSCDPGDNDGIVGYIYTSQSVAASTPLKSCRIGNEIFESTTCESYPIRGSLGYLKGSGPLRRYLGGGVDHHVTTGRGPAGATLEGFMGQLVQGYAANRHPLYSCRHNASARDHFISLNRNCEGQEYLALEGYAYDSPPPGVPTLQIYRCWYPGGHFVSAQSNCEGQTTEMSLGYTYNP
ncbi:MAG TPA: hypothetical protein VKB23_05065 [Solirubrobacterales bacterium]|nr:hypothetical protein [Solirubrobacterales bacterium]